MEKAGPEEKKKRERETRLSGQCEDGIYHTFRESIIFPLGQKKTGEVFDRAQPSNYTRDATSQNREASSSSRRIRELGHWSKGACFQLILVPNVKHRLNTEDWSMGCVILYLLSYSQGF